MIFNEPDYTLKTIIIGDSKVGKTSFLKLLQKHTSKNVVSTIGVDFASLYYNITNKTIKLNVWDTAGQERFVTVVRSYFRSLCSIILMFDVSDPQTLINLEKWMGLIEYENSCPHKHPILLIGNKTDLKKNIDELQVNHFINKYTKYNIIYREISCRNCSPLDELMTTLIRSVLKSVECDKCNGILNHDNFNNSFSLSYKDDDSDNDSCDNQDTTGKGMKELCCTIS
jgi:small GTP-binding protein